MALRIIESFTHFATNDMTKKWDYQDNMEIKDVDPRRAGSKYIENGPKFWTYDGIIRRRIGLIGPTVIVGIALKHYRAGEIRVSFMSGTTVNIYISVLESGDVRLTCGGVDVTSNTSPVPGHTWLYMQCKVYLHASAGTYELKIGEDVVFSGADVDTLNTVASVDEVRISLPGVYVENRAHVTDLYICDGEGIKNNDFLGDCRADVLNPNAPGDSAQLTPSAGANWENVDDPGDIDDDATHNQSQTIGHKDFYNLSSISALGKEIFGIAQNSCVRKTDAGFARIQQALKAGTTENLSSDIQLSDNYKVYQRILELNPDDDEDFEESDLNALQTGIKVTLAG